MLQKLRSERDGKDGFLTGRGFRISRGEDRLGLIPQENVLLHAVAIDGKIEREELIGDCVHKKERLIEGPKYYYRLSWQQQREEGNFTSLFGIEYWLQLWQQQQQHCNKGENQLFVNPRRRDGMVAAASRELSRRKSGSCNI